MNALVSAGLIVGIFFVIGVVVGIISVIAMAAIRTDRKPELTGNEHGPPDSDTDDNLPHWPDHAR